MLDLRVRTLLGARMKVHSDDQFGTGYFAGCYMEVSWHVGGLIKYVERKLFGLLHLIA